jgi:hypothetical protein
MKNTLINFAGAILGGVIGYFAFGWIVRQGLYAMILPGGLVGLGASIAKNRSITIPIICGAAALALGFFTEWQFFPFAKDESLSYFLAHIHHLQPISLIMIAIGGFLGFWMPYARIEKDRSAAPAQAKLRTKDKSEDEPDE